ncbi:MAG: YqiA/YcfP family alpha/beta fold hydrolase [Microcoleaceae cyanobacterium]
MVSSETTYLYLHGFASSPQSRKAQYLQDRFRDLQLHLHLPDLNQEDFSRLTLTRQLQQIESEFSPQTSKKRAIIGSSFGGLTATWLTQRQFQADQLILLAPAFEFLQFWLPKLGSDQLEQWKTKGFLSVYHYSEQRQLPLNYQFVQDLMQYPDEQLIAPIPTLILHGQQDETIPIQASRDFAATRPWVKLIELESDHSLGNVLEQIWSEIKYCLSL